MDELNATVKVTRTGAYALIEEDGKILLVRQEGGPYKGRWDLPGGRIEPDEEVLDALKREIKEEVDGSFDEAKLIDALSVTFKQENFVLTQIGILYEVKSFKSKGRGDLEKGWFDLKKLPDTDLAGLALKLKKLRF